MKHLLFFAMTFSFFACNGFAQKKAGKLSEEKLHEVAQQMENNWRFSSSTVRWLENESSLNYYLNTASGRCPDELEDVLRLSKEWYENNRLILQLEQQIYPKPGSEKSEANLARYFTDPEKAKKTIAAAHQAVKDYERMEQLLTPLIKAGRKQTYTPPQGELTHFEFRQGGGMVRRPPYHGELQRLKDGTYIALLDTHSFNKLDTVAVTQAQVDTIRKMLIDGEVYKMPRFSDSPYLLLDGPSSSVSVDFTDASFSCHDFPPSKWGGSSILPVYNYLRALSPLRDPTEEELRMMR